MKKGLGIIIGILFSLSIFSQNDSLIHQLELQFLRKQYDSLIETTHRVVKQDSSIWQVYFYRGKGYQSKYQYFKAIENYENALKVDSANAIIESELAVVYDFVGKDEEAISIYHNQYLRDTLDLNPIVRLANIFRRKREFASAIHYYQKAVSLDPENFYYYKQLGFCFQKINIPTGAIYSYRTAIMLNPYDASMYIQLANIMNTERVFDEAIDIGLKGLEKFPDNRQLFKIIAYANYLNRDLDSSLVYFNQLLAEGDSSFFNFKYRGLTYFEKKAFPKAIEDLESAYELNKKDAELTFYLGSALGRSGISLQGISYLHRTLNILSPPKDELSNIYSELAFIYQHQEKYQKALDYLKLAYKAKAEPILSFKMAQLYDYYLDNKKLAIDYYDGYLTMTNQPDTLATDSSYVIENSFTRNEKIKENAEDRIKFLKEELFFEEGNKK